MTFHTRRFSTFSASKVQLCGTCVSLDGMDLRLSRMEWRLLGLPERFTG
jgi:hypothetical protein